MGCGVFACGWDCAGDGTGCGRAAAFLRLDCAACRASSAASVAGGSAGVSAGFVEAFKSVGHCGDFGGVGSALFSISSGVTISIVTDWLGMLPSGLPWA